MTNMLHTTETRISAEGVHSLVWEESALVDWVDGGQRYPLSGDVIPRAVRYAFAFDAAVSWPGSNYAAIYAKGQTKALILRRGDIHREVNRSYYQAGAYEYPIAIFRLNSGREVLAHCPDEYCRLQIEDLVTGEVLTNSAARKPADFFHSRLAASADGRYLVSAGWLWQPVDDVRVYSVEEALKDPCHLDGDGLGIRAWAEESSATFMPDGRLAVALYGIEDEVTSEVDVGITELRLFDVQRPREPVVVRMSERLGAVVAVDSSHVLALYEHPRLVDLRTGTVVQSWPHIASGDQTSSIFVSASSLPVMAFDSARMRYAFADDAGITVLQFNCE